MKRDFEALCRMAADARHRAGAPGLGIAAVTPGGELAEGFGVADVRYGTPVNRNSVFPIASATKTFTSAALALLVEDGKLGWDDPVRRHIDYFPEPAGGNPPVTIRDVLSHRTGFGRHDPLWCCDRWGRQETLRRLCRMGIEKPLRSRFGYSNLMYVLAGEVVASVSGMPFEAFVESRLLARAGMFDTGFSRPAVRPHFPSGAAACLPGEVAPLEKVNASCGLRSSPHDLTNWLRAQLGGHGALLAERSLNEMHRPHIDVLPSEEPRLYSFFGERTRLSYGLGWFIADHRGWKLLAHSGVWPGYRAHIALLPEKGIGIAAVANLNFSWVTEAVVYAGLDRLLGAADRDWNEHFAAISKQQQQEELPSSPGAGRSTPPAASYSGVYENPGYGTIQIAASDGAMRFGWAGFAGSLVEKASGRLEVELRDSAFFPEPLPVELLPGERDRAARVRFLDQEFVRARG